MELKLILTEEEKIKLKNFINDNSKNKIYEERLRNIKNKEAIRNKILSKDEIWKALINCLLTTQQKSGPGKAIHRFMEQKPFPLTYKYCVEIKDENIEEKVVKILTDFKGIRRINIIAKAIKYNIKYLKNGGWKYVCEVIRNLKEAETKEKERQEIEKLLTKNNKFLQIGPKQIRNLFQMLGLVKYEIPIDSRTTKWLNDYGFPIKVNGDTLGNEKSYNFVLDLIQDMSKQIEFYPTLLDAAIFTSFDPKGAWE